MPLEVEIGNNKSFIVCDVCQNCKLSIDDEDYTIDLIPMSMGEFQVIVGVDWLSRYHAKVACFRKEIKLTSPSKKHITIYGEKGGNCHTPIFPRITGGEYRDVVDIIIVKQHNLNAQWKQKINILQSDKK